ncbi:hypothetical protein V6N12_066514 [Hibiscus sabdariffa]|uniref:Uncharacterized protein n=1 Tax=Hibiscus sabdariffa TaxID=183260 RepID=A0ABR2CQC9_9ROSI
MEIRRSCENTNTECIEPIEQGKYRTFRSFINPPNRSLAANIEGTIMKSKCKCWADENGKGEASTTIRDRDLLI